MTPAAVLVVARTIAAIGATVALQATPAPRAIQLSEPTTIARLDSGTLGGEPVQLAWSDDGTLLCLQVARRDARGMLTGQRYYMVSASNGAIEPIDAPPTWASEYWRWKSNKSAPASGKFAIDIKETFRNVAATATPMGGALAKGGDTGDPNAGLNGADAINHALQTQKEHVFTLRLKGETVGEFVNSQFLPGYTFGWSPPPLVLIAYANSGGHLAVMNEKGAKFQAPATRNVILPAWTLDGRKIAIVQRTGKSMYDLSVVDVKR